MQKTIDRYIQDIHLPRKTFFEEQIHTAVGVIIQNSERVYRVRKETAKQQKIACTMLIEGLYQTYCTLSNSARLCLSLSHSGYSKKDRLKINKVGSRTMNDAVQALVQLGWIFVKKGYVSGSGKNIPTKMMPIGQLLKAFQDKGIAWQELQPTVDQGLIILKDYDPKTKEKTVIPTPDTRKVRLMRSNIKKINTFLSQHAICLHRNDKNLFVLAEKMSQDSYSTEWFDNKPTKKARLFNFSHTAMTRIFARSNMSKGGRFYGGWWQFIPREERKYITIDGMGTIEIDYSEMHPRLLYLEQGLKPPKGDLYDLNIRVEGLPFDPENERYKAIRGVVKRYINALINDENGFYKLPKSDQEIIGMDTKQLRELVIKKHPKIQDSLGAGRGLSFQYFDSQIAEGVMLTLLEKNIVCLPIHDSFICQFHHAKDLHEAMTTAYKKVFKDKPKIKLGIRYKSDFQIIFQSNGEVDRQATMEQHTKSIHNSFFLSWVQARAITAHEGEEES
jgi:hypothetical protein